MIRTYTWYLVTTAGTYYMHDTPGSLATCSLSPGTRYLVPGTWHTRQQQQRSFSASYRRNVGVALVPVAWYLVPGTWHTRQQQQRSFSASSRRNVASEQKKKKTIFIRAKPRYVHILIWTQTTGNSWINGDLLYCCVDSTIYRNHA